MCAYLSSTVCFKSCFGLQVRAKMPRGDWLWPAIWMLPLENSYAHDLNTDKMRFTF